MELIVDANVVFSALISPVGKTCDLLFSDQFELFAPEFLMEEFEKYKQEILNKSGLAEVEFDLVLALIFSRIRLIPFEDFQQYISKASKSCPDPNDVEYFALALKFDCLIWSDDKKLKEQSSVKILSTSELLLTF